MIQLGDRSRLDIFLGADVNRRRAASSGGMMPDEHFDEDTHPPDGEISDVSSNQSGHSGNSQRSVFSTKVLKDRTMTYRIKEREKRELEEQKEMEERRKA